MTGLWWAAALAPLSVALGLAVVGLVPQRATVAGRTVLMVLAPVTVLPAGLLGLLGAGDDGAGAVGASGAVGGPAGEVYLSWLLLGTSFRLDPIGRPLLVMTAALYGLALIMVARSGIPAPPRKAPDSTSTIDRSRSAAEAARDGHIVTDESGTRGSGRSAADPRAPALSGLLLVCFVANAGVFVSADVITLYLCFTVMSLVGYALVIHDRSANARRSGRIYLFLAIVGEAAVLVAAMLVVRAGGLDLGDTAAVVAASEHTGWIVALLWVGFGIKVGVVPLHVWLPLAHPAAPTPASAVLSGAMITGGLAGWLRMMPLGQEPLPGWGLVFVIGGLAGAYVAVALGVLQVKAKAVLAYSSISQMGLLSALVGAALLRPELTPVLIAAAVLYAVHHGLVKAALFFGVGLWDTHGEDRPGPGLGVGRWLVLGGLSVAGLSVAGLPWTSGYLAKYAAKDASDGVLAAGVDVSSALVLVGTGSTVLLARTVWLLVRSHLPSRPRGGGLLVPAGRAGSGAAAPGDPAADGGRAPVTTGNPAVGRPPARASTPRGSKPLPVDVTLMGWLALIAVSIPLVLWTAGLTGLVQLPGWWDLATWWAQSWPVLLGLVLAAAVLRLAAAEVLPRWLGHPDGRVVPPGDLVVIEEWAAIMIRAGARALGTRLRTAREHVVAAARGLPAPAGWFNAAEQRLATWRASGVTFLGLLTVLFALMWWSP